MAVVIETTIGDMTVDLFIQERPLTCKNFLKLCKIKYYNFCLFHSVQSNFLAQTGDPSGVGTGGESIYGVINGEESKFYEGETMPKIKHDKPGLLSMVNCGNNMLGSQFFVTLGPDLQSLEEHCVFAEITEGHDVLLKLNETICDFHHRPYQDIRITHTVVLEDPFEDPPGMLIPDMSPDISQMPSSEGRIAADEKINDEEGLTNTEIEEMKAEREAKARATILEIVGDIPDADVAPPENVLFVCKLNPVTTDEDLEIIFSRFGKIKSCEVIRDHVTGDSLQYAFIEFEDQKACEQAYFKMDNVLIDDRRIHVDFSQSVSKMKWRGKGRGVQYFDKQDEKEPYRTLDNRYSGSRRDNYRERERDRERSDNRRRDDERSRSRRGERESEDHRRRERRKVGEDSLSSSSSRRREEGGGDWREEEAVRWEEERKRRERGDERRNREEERRYNGGGRREERRRGGGDEIGGERRVRVDGGSERRRNGGEKKSSGGGMKDESTSHSTTNKKYIGDIGGEGVTKEDKSERREKSRDLVEMTKERENRDSLPQLGKEKIVECKKGENDLDMDYDKLKNEIEKVNTDSPLEMKESNSYIENDNDSKDAEKTSSTRTKKKLLSQMVESKKKKRLRKESSSSDSSSTDSSDDDDEDSSSSSSSLDWKKKPKHSLTVAKKYYHDGKLVKVVKKKKGKSSDSDSDSEYSSDSDKKKRKRKHKKKIIKVFMKKKRKKSSDESDSDSSSSEDSEPSKYKKRRKKNQKIMKKKKINSRKVKKKSRGSSESSEQDISDKRLGKDHKYSGAEGKCKYVK